MRVAIFGANRAQQVRLADARLAAKQNRRGMLKAAGGDFGRTIRIFVTSANDQTVQAGLRAHRRLAFGWRSRAIRWNDRKRCRFFNYLTARSRPRRRSILSGMLLRTWRSYARLCRQRLIDQEFDTHVATTECLTNR